MKCIRDSVGVCQHHAAARQIVFVPVDGRTVFLLCMFLIAMNVVWLVLWVKKGVRFEEDV